MDAYLYMTTRFQPIFICLYVSRSLNLKQLLNGFNLLLLQRKVYFEAYTIVLFLLRIKDQNVSSLHCLQQGQITFQLNELQTADKVNKTAKRAFIIYDWGGGVIKILRVTKNSC